MIYIVNDTNTYPGEVCGLSDDHYKIFSNKNDKWIELPAVSIRGFSSELLGIARASNGITQIKINWKDRYGTLKSGKYKLVVPVSYCEKIGDYDYKFENGEVAIDFEI